MAHDITFCYSQPSVVNKCTCKKIDIAIGNRPIGNYQVALSVSYSVISTQCDVMLVSTGG